ncbi:DUF6183 family protein [Streptomyces sp. MBT53]|uniref:DUF6183 family protein n=1 Tax=Streptomyces sp. MBT53 TaxID=1488384 RepID=UPI00191431AA|nr:DUF6183 family protein [Streptomyces sp. MBT53]MBK6016985.1 hypothetical protein [Streptomyces sp. MBT53]
MSDFEFESAKSTHSSGDAHGGPPQGDASYLRKRGEQLADRHADAVRQVREYERQLAHVVRMLAFTPGRDSLVNLLRLLDEKRPSIGSPRPLLPFVASVLAEHHQVSDLVAVVFEPRGREYLNELRACLFHELVLRGVRTDAYPALRSAVHVPPWHPLFWLPAHRIDVESGADFPRRSVNGSAYGVPSQLPAEGRVDLPTPRTSERSALHDTATADVRESIVAAVRVGEWAGHGAWVFTLDEALPPECVPALLPTLPMGCLDGLGPTDRFEVAVRPLDEIWRLLFDTASMGGMYDSGVHGAYGRLWAWRSIAGLSGAPAGASAEEVEHRARQSTWFHFEADTDWFHGDIDSDYGVAALSPDRRRIAVLAATDTD